MITSLDLRIGAWTASVSPVGLGSTAPFTFQVMEPSPEGYETLMKVLGRIWMASGSAGAEARSLARRLVEGHIGVVRLTSAISEAPPPGLMFTLHLLGEG